MNFEMDFTSKKYCQLMETLRDQGFLFLTISAFFKSGSGRKPLIMLRHDVEARYGNALKMAVIQHEMGIQGTYYFRIFPDPQNMRIIKSIAEMGHEIGYHYDDLSVCNGNHKKAIQRFERNLLQLRKVAPVQSITMEGAPLSRYDNRDLWKHYKYQDFGITNEPYFDLDFNQIFYLTDTGRRWDGHLYNVRDKATRDNPVTNPQFLKLRFHSTKDIIAAIERRAAIEKPITMDTDNGSPLQKNQNPEQRTKNTPFDPARAGLRARMPEHITLNNKHETPNNNQIFPNQAMLNFHPQRWNDAFVPWMKELVWQNVKNQGKLLLIKSRNFE